MGLHEPPICEATAEPPAGEHSEAWELRELLGETAPRPVLRRADGWWKVVPESTAMRVGLLGVLVRRMRRWLVGGSVLSCPPLVWLA